MSSLFVVAGGKFLGVSVGSFFGSELHCVRAVVRAVRRAVRVRILEFIFCYSGVPVVIHFFCGWDFSGSYDA